MVALSTCIWITDEDGGLEIRSPYLGWVHVVSMCIGLDSHGKWEAERESACTLGWASVGGVKGGEASLGFEKVEGEGAIVQVEGGNGGGPGGEEEGMWSGMHCDESGGSGECVQGGGHERAEARWNGGKLRTI
ncbi:hypothetical protein Tco_0745499 [Tanacetum coccineum]